MVYRGWSIHWRLVRRRVFRNSAIRPSHRSLRPMAICNGMSGIHRRFPICVVPVSELGLQQEERQRQRHQQQPRRQQHLDPFLLPRCRLSVPLDKTMPTISITKFIKRADRHQSRTTWRCVKCISNTNRISNSINSNSSIIINSNNCTKRRPCQDKSTGRIRQGNGAVATLPSAHRALAVTVRTH